MAGQNKHWVDGLPIKELSGSTQNRHWVDGLPISSIEDATTEARLTDLIVQNLRAGLTAPARMSAVIVQNLRGGFTPSSRFTGLVTQLIKSPKVPPGRLTKLTVQNLQAGITPPVRLTSIIVQRIVGTTVVVGDAIYNAGATIPEDGLVAQAIIGLAITRSGAKVYSGGYVQGADTPTDGSDLRLFIAGVNQKEYYVDGTLRIDLQSNFQGSASFTLIDEEGAYIPLEGMTVRLEYFDAGIPEINSGAATEIWHRVFSGKIGSVTRSKVNYLASGSVLKHEVQCVDYVSWIAKRRISRSYASGLLLSAILSDINVSYLEPEGINWVNLGTATDVMGAITWDRITIVEALNFLSDATNKSWIIDANAALYFEDSPNPSTPPFVLAEDTEETWANLTVKETLALYANQVTVRSSAQIENPPQVSEMSNFTSENTPTFPHFRYFDGTEYKDYTWKGQVNRITSIKINGTERAFFVNGDTPPDPWYFLQVTPGDIDLIYNHGDHGFLSIGDTVTVQFEVSTSSIPPVTVRDQVEIDERRAIEGGTGVHEADYSIENVTDLVQLQRTAEAILAKSKIKGVEVNADVLAFGLLPGHQMPASTFASYGVTTEVDLRVDSVSMWDIGGFTKRLHTRVLVSNSGVQRDGITAIRDLIERIRTGTNAGSGGGGSSSGGSRDLPITINLALGTPSVPSTGLVVGTNVTSVLALDQNFSPRSISAIAKTAPVGSPFTIMIKAGGVDILSAPLSYPETGGLHYYNNLLVTSVIPAGTILSVDVLSVGSTDPGSDVTIVLTGRV